MATVDDAATVEIAALICINNTKDLFISCSRQPVEWLSSSRLDVLSAKNPRNYPTRCRLVFPRPGGWRLESRQISNQVPISNRRAGLEVLGERGYRGKNRATKHARKLQERL